MILGARSFLAVEDDPRLRALLCSVLCPPGWTPMSAASGSEALAVVASGSARPDVALVDLGLPDMDGVTLIERLAVLRPALPIIVLSVCHEERRILDAFQAGARGYVFKEDLGRGLEAALVEALAGGAPMSRAVARLVLAQLRRNAAREPGSAASPALTERERQVVEQLARGLAYDQVAVVMSISANTVRTHVRAIYEKLSVCSKTEAVLAALRFGLISTPAD